MYLTKKQPLKLLALLTFTLSAWGAQAQNSVIPYQGTLFSQGKPVSQTEPVRMAFAIYSDDAGLDAGQDGNAPSGEARKWTSWDVAGEGGDSVNDVSKTVGVQVRNGRFFVHLGETEAGQQPLGDDVFDASELYVVVWLMQDTENPNAVFRLPPQRLQTVPHAVTAKRANGFEVGGLLKVDAMSPNLSDQIRVHGELEADSFITSSLIGKHKGSVVSDGEWHDILPSSAELNVYRVVTFVNKSGCNSVGHFLALRNYHVTRIEPVQAVYNGCSVELEWRLDPGLSAALRLRSSSDFNLRGGIDTYRPPIYYSITELKTR